MLSLSIEAAYNITIGLLLLSTLVSSVELALIPVIYNPFVFPEAGIKKQYVQNQTLLIAQTVFSIITLFLAVYGEYIFFKVSFMMLGALVLFAYKRRTISRNGSDQLRNLAYIILIMCFVLDDYHARLLPMYFMGGQILIAYATSGIAKLLSPMWRRGDVLSKVLSTFSFGIPSVAAFLLRRPLLEKLLSFGAIAVMLAVPVCFFIPAQTPLIVALSMMLAFHFSTAVLMGLNDFLITFPLGYPGVLLLHVLLFQQ